MSCAGKERISDKNSMYNRNHTDESREKMSNNASRKYGKDNPNWKREYKESEKTYDTWKVKNKDGEEFIINNLNKFCKENNLNASCMRDIYYGRMKSHKNWILVEKITDNVKKKKTP
jgi:hypothetical protein